MFKEKESSLLNLFKSKKCSILKLFRRKDGIMKITKFEDLEVWELGKKLAVEIHNIILNKRIGRNLSLKDQIERAAVSITSIQTQ